MIAQHAFRSSVVVAALALVVALLPSRCLAMMDIERVTPERATALGVKIVANAAGPSDIRVVMDLSVKGELKSFSRVDLQLEEGGKLGLFASLREEKAEPGHVVVSFAASRADLGKITLRIVTGAGTFEMSGYDFRVKDFVDVDKIH